VRAAAKVLGIIGGILGIILGGLVIIVMIGSTKAASGTIRIYVFGIAQDNTQVVVLGFVSILLAIAAIVGGAMAKNHRMVASILLLAPAILGFILIREAWFLPSLLLLVGGVLESVSKPTTTATQPSQ